MILQALCAYYARMARDPNSGMPKPGFSSEKISFALSLKPDGSLARIVDLREQEGKKLKERKMLVPASVKRAVNICPNFLWDNTGYVLGVDSKGKPDRTEKAFAAFKELHEKAAQENGHPMLGAVAAFLQNWKPDAFETLTDVDPQELLDRNCVFMWDETQDFIHDQEGVYRPDDTTDSEDLAWCLVSGTKARTARLHPSIKGVWGGQSSGGSIVSFNLDAFTSYGKDQNFNAPVSEEAASAYVAALNYLLDRTHQRCLQIGDASTVFWAEKETPAEDVVYSLLTGGDKKAEETGPAANPEKKPKGKSQKERVSADTVGQLLAALRQGRDIESALPDIKPGIRFYILGLAPNAARIAVRFWFTKTFGELAANAALHQEHTAIERQYASSPEFLSLWQLMVHTAVQNKTENILPNLAAGLARSLLTGTMYPQAVLTTVLGRIRADQTVSYERASLIKGLLVRNYLQEVPFMLDTQRQDVPYLLGRLFALLEKAQQDALGSVNAGIREKFIGSASTMPGVVFPRLLHLTQHHIAKSAYGESMDRRIAEVAENISEFPKRLQLQDQGIFFIGYYQQRNALYRKPATEEK